MPIEHRRIEVVAIQDNQRHRVEAILSRDIDNVVTNYIESQWAEPRAWLDRIIEAEGGTLESAHWDWNAKHDENPLRPRRFVAITYDGLVQGAMAVLVEPRPSRLEPVGSKMLYVDYIETAPWNIRPMTGRQRLGSVGTVLLAEAIRLSTESGYEGRIDLHALPQAERFYKEVLEMSDLGKDPDYDGLRYFEYNSSAANEWLKRKGL
jgi:hypothetical protein